MNMSQFIYSQTDGCFGCFQLQGIAHKAAVSIHVQALVWPCAFTSLGHGIAKSYDKFVFSILTSSKNILTILKEA